MENNVRSTEEVNEGVKQSRANFVRINLRQMKYKVLQTTASRWSMTNQDAYTYEFWVREDNRFNHASKVILQIDRDGDVELFMLADTSRSIGDSLKKLRELKPEDTGQVL